MTAPLFDSVTVDIKDKAYPIYFISQPYHQPQQFISHIKSSHVMIVTNSTVAEIYLQSWHDLLVSSGYKVNTCILPDGEQYKNWQTLNQIYDALLEQSYSRNSTLLALGGGVIGDMTGFAAATYQRGIHFIQVPTTLLAQVDSSVGGKTAINHPMGKNMIGAFYQPDAVFIDMHTLSTLPAGEFSAGLAEVIKYGCIDDDVFFDFLEANIKAILKLQTEVLSQTIKRCCQIKATIVAEDETECSGRRALLNFGHTFGHAIEAYKQYQGILHGQAVAIGMLIATKLSVMLGLVDDEFYQRLYALLIKAGLPVKVPAGMGIEDFIYYMKKDKKSSHGQIKLILLDQPGQARLRNDINEDMICDCLKAFMSS